MELAYGRAIFDRYGWYAADPVAIVVMLEDAVTDMLTRPDGTGETPHNTGDSPTRVPWSARPT
jgi:hypothetical protein